ncbi:hypothetical protein NHX12_006730 [Muraenolepis orangiensis]|uniref:Uncharacterized protein n=1 Tax=Muraenolepis orangiensis TaxID=630683 RepID=A0A9Q0I920_9TELE|nr:hypothetical protein NHX12_006730 [Muraenolepis orangiensis]
MAALQEPEIQFAQRLASNEKPIRSKAIKKLTKYIMVRSHQSKGGFTSEELLKLWKGLFYCLWMQDKPLLQEELSNQISGLFHCFQTADGQLMYLEAFLQTVKREWTGIDRLRMDKFYQLVRFIFRQTFEVLKKREWDASLVNRFLEMLTSQVLQGTGTAPSGLQFHILDLYLTELGRVGSVELSADQNLTLIIPFCKVVAKTKDHILFKAICNSIFSTIIDQAPFAIEDLLREMKAAEDSDNDSGQASQGGEEEEEEEEEMKEKPVRKKSKKKAKGKLVNGTKSKVAEDDEDDDLSLEELDTALPDDEGSEPVLQFDYAALADKLFEFASRGNAPNHNRQRLYKIIKILRDLSEGVFPQDGYPEEVSTDEDDEMFCSRQRMKRKVSRNSKEEEEEKEAPAAKKNKKRGKKTEESNDGEDTKDSEDEEEPAKKKKRRKKKKAGGEVEKAGEVEVEKAGEVEVEKAGEVEVEKAEVATPTETQATAEDQSKQSPPAVTEAAGQAPLKTMSNKRKRGKKSITPAEPTSQVAEPPTETQEQEASVGPAPPGGSPAVEPDASTVQKGKKNNKKSLVVEAVANGVEAVANGVEAVANGVEAVANGVEAVANGVEAVANGVEAVANGVEAVANGVEAAPTPPGEAAPDATGDSDKTTTTPPKKRNRRRSRKSLTALDVADEASAPEAPATTQAPEATTETTETATKTTETATPAKGKKRKASRAAAGVKGQLEAKSAADCEPMQPTEGAATPKKNKIKTKKNANKPEAECPEADDVVVAVDAPTPQKKKNKKTSKTEEAAEPKQDQAPSAVAVATPTLKKKKKKATAAEEEKDATQEHPEVPDTPATPVSQTMVQKKKRKIPVVFEFEADEVNSLASKETLVTPKKAKLQNARKELVSFQKKTIIPTPLFFRTKGTPQSKKPQTPKSDTKKVTFGLKNNKTAEFRKSDRSLLLTPEGSSRVPFDPTQKPKFGVLKSPGPASPMVFRKTPKPSKKTPNGTPKQRPTAADFF